MLFLIGLRASGKTTIGRALADKLERPFLDLDEDIERVAGATVADLLKESAARFRELEHECLVHTLQNAPAGLVLACGGGTPAQPANAQLFQFSINIYVTAPVAVLAERMEASPATRPLLAGQDVTSEIVILQNQRTRMYQKIADILVAGDGDLADAVAEICAALHYYEDSEKVRFARLAGAIL